MPVEGGVAGGGVEIKLDPKDGVDIEESQELARNKEP